MIPRPPPRVSATEYWYRGTVALRAGYRLAGYGNLQGLAGLSAGVGVKLEQAELDYALTTLRRPGVWQSNFAELPVWPL